MEGIKYGPFVDVVCVWMLGGLWFSEEFYISNWTQLLKMSVLHKHNTTVRLLVVLSFLRTRIHITYAKDTKE